MDYTECRALQHAWATDYTELIRRGWANIHLQCMRCPVNKEITIRFSTGETIVKYVYPKDYVNKGNGRVPKVFSKIEWAKRTLAENVITLKAVK